MKNLVLGIFITLALSSCGMTKRPYDLSAKDSVYLSSGTIVLSRQLPEESQVTTTSSSSAADQEKTFSPVVGYIPPLSGILPASNELWVEVDSKAMTVNVYRGEEMVKSVPAEGTIDLAPGKYALQYKQKFPTWYAPDSYFEKRRLQVPSKQDQTRFRKGALGDFALYPTSAFAIHCSPILSQDVGGLRLNRDDLASLFTELPLGTSVVVK